MDVIVLEEAPSQRFPIKTGDVSYVLQAMYNQIANRWSYTFWPVGTDNDECPLIAGTFMSENTNLLKGISETHALLVVPTAGSNYTLNLYHRYTKIRKLGTSDTFLVLGTLEEFEDLLNYNNVQPIC